MDTQVHPFMDDLAQSFTAEDPTPVERPTAPVVAWLVMVGHYVLIDLDSLLYGGPLFKSIFLAKLLVLQSILYVLICLPDSLLAFPGSSSATAWFEER